jgi:hypothetical protein
MDSPDKDLDTWIASTLQTGTNIPSLQKQLAWERLSEKAMQQAMLPPLLKIETRQKLSRFDSARALFWRWLTALTVEEARYEQARRNRNLMRYQYLNPNGEVALHFLTPLRLSV